MSGKIRYLPVQRIRHRIDTLGLDEKSLQRLAGLSICQALEHDPTLVTVNEQIQAYPVTTC